MPPVNFLANPVTNDPSNSDGLSGDHGSVEGQNTVGVRIPLGSHQLSARESIQLRQQRRDAWREFNVRRTAVAASVAVSGQAIPADVVRSRAEPARSIVFRNIESSSRAASGLSRPAGLQPLHVATPRFLVEPGSFASWMRLGNSMSSEDGDTTASSQHHTIPSDAEGVITALEATRPTATAAPVELDRSNNPVHSSTAVDYSDILHPPPTPTRLTAAAQHASLLLATFAHLSPPPIDAVTPAQQSLLTAALTSLLTITRELRIAATSPLDPLPVAEDIALCLDSGCVICYARVANIVLIPCWHLTLCEECCVEMELRGGGSIMCPICRAGVTERVSSHRERCRGGGVDL